MFSVFGNFPVCRTVLNLQPFPYSKCFFVKHSSHKTKRIILIKHACNKKYYIQFSVLYKHQFCTVYHCCKERTSMWYSTVITICYNCKAHATWMSNKLLMPLWSWKSNQRHFIQTKEGHQLQNTSTDSTLLYVLLHLANNTLV